MKASVYTRPPKPKQAATIARPPQFRAAVAPLPAPVVVGAGSECFTTPAPVVRRMLEHAGTVEGLAVLEPSAGPGVIARMARDAGAAVVVVIEREPALCAVLRGHNFTAAPCDFLAQVPGQLPHYQRGQLFDRVLMNPPFSGLQDIAHIRHAFEFLKPGGRLVAITSPSWTYNQARKAAEFRTWFELVGGVYEQLPAGSFAASGTEVSTLMLVIDR